MKAIAWAVLCKSGEVHTDDEHSFMFLDKGQAVDAKNDQPWLDNDPDDAGCGPHRVVTLYRRVK